MSNPAGDAAIDARLIRADIVDTFGLSGISLMRPLSGDSKRTILGFFLIAALAVIGIQLSFVGQPHAQTRSPRCLVVGIARQNAG